MCIQLRNHFCGSVDLSAAIGPWLIWSRWWTIEQARDAPVMRDLEHVVFGWVNLLRAHPLGTFGQLGDVGPQLGAALDFNDLHTSRCQVGAHDFGRVRCAVPALGQQHLQFR